MSQFEKYGKRSLSYSAWHRSESLRRYIDQSHYITDNATMIDVDWVEYDHLSRKPIALIETAEDIGQNWKAAEVIRQLAQMANLPGYVVLYKLSQTRKNPNAVAESDIDQFRVRRLHPNEQKYFVTMTPEEYANLLVRMHLGQE